MSEVKQAHDAFTDLRDQMIKKEARDAFRGCVALLWRTHGLSEVKAIIGAAYEEISEENC